MTFFGAVLWLGAGIYAGILRALDGRNFIPRWAQILLLSSLTGALLVPFSPWWMGPMAMACAAVCWAFLFCAPWGLYFAAIDGFWRADRRDNPWIEGVGFKLVPWVNEFHIPSNRERGLVCMSLRWMCYSWPIFALHGMVFDAWGLAAALWPLSGWVGAMYWLLGFTKPHPGEGFKTTWPEFASLLWFHLLFGAIFAGANL